MINSASIINITCVSIMLAIFGYYWMEKKKYKPIEKELDSLLEELKNIEEEQVPRKLQSSKYTEIKGELNAFNETLILKDGKFYSTIEIEKYFNSVTMLEEKLNMKEIINIPSIFPGMGILGTFIGLAFGLNSVKTGGSSNDILSSIQPLLDNISVAFITSIVGISFSLIATFSLNKFLGAAEKRILKIEDLINRRFPIYTKILQGEELLKEIKEIKMTSNGMATDISNQLGEHISTQVGMKIDSLVCGSNEIMKGLTENIGNKVEKLTNTISNDFGDNLTGALDKIFTEDLVGSFKKLGEDIVNISNENMENLNNFKSIMSEVILDLNDVRDNYEEINNKTTETNKDVIESLTHLTSTISERVISVDENLEKTVGVFNDAAIQVKSLEQALSNSLKETSSTIEKLSDYMNINQEISNSMNKFINSEEKILKLWDGYDEKFTDLNKLLFEGASSFENSLNQSVDTYKNQLNGIRDEFSTMMGSLNQKYSDYTNKNTVNLFQEYDKHLSTAINRFNGLMGSLGEEVEGLQVVIETHNDRLGEVIESNEIKNLENRDMQL